MGSREALLLCSLVLTRVSRVMLVWLRSANRQMKTSGQRSGLVSWSIWSAGQSSHLDDLIISTDDGPSALMRGPQLVLSPI